MTRTPQVQANGHFKAHEAKGSEPEQLVRDGLSFVKPTNKIAILWFQTIGFRTKERIRAWFELVSLGVRYLEFYLKFLGRLESPSEGSSRVVSACRSSIWDVSVGKVNAAEPQGPEA